MPSTETIYDTSRVLGTITAGIFTGLAASAPLYTLPSLLNHTAYDRARPASNLEKFQDVNKAASSALNLAGISGAAFLVAAYTAPTHVAYNAKFVGRGASEIGAQFPSDRLFARLTTSRGLLLSAGAGLILLIPFSALIVGPIAKSTINMRMKLQAEQIAGTAAGVPSRGQDEFDKQLKKWGVATEVVAFLGLVATVSGTMQLVGVGL
ncbi:putative transmembrane protein [Rhizoctonia solani 123E]|uniref:Putative transmembrane protein n=1 Tax=Rhizoctonia solani 123E TaxID=1423351 RepID=A0A074SAE8_9AGAM|nr:putative transmembrane protein [Rhizoctonia solani 123E]